MKKLIIPIIICLTFFSCLCSILDNKEVYANNIHLLSDITLTYESQEWKYFKPNFENFFLESLKQQKEKEILRKGIRNFVIEKKSLGLSDIEIIDEIYPKFSDFFENVKKSIESELKECEIMFNPTKKEMWNFSDEKIGRKIDTNDLLLSICTNTPKIELKVDEIKPTFQKKDLMNNTTLRSTQTTSFVGSEKGRRFNIIKALDCFNGLIVLPNEEVSFQKILDKNDNGIPYQEATVILNGEFVKGIGGGICQASTTIYNSALMAGLEIIEVHNHTLPVGYVEKGFDAMVNDSGLDLRFRNNTNYPIYFKTYAKNSTAFAEVYGEKMNYSLKKVSEQTERIEPPEPKVIPDKKGEYSSHITFKGEFFTKRYAQYGYKVNAFLEIYENNEFKEKKLIRKETYAPTQSIIYEGTKERNQTNEEEFPTHQW